MGCIIESCIPVRLHLPIVVGGKLTIFSPP
jgi:hypothetical protein